MVTKSVAVTKTTPDMFADVFVCLRLFNLLWSLLLSMVSILLSVKNFVD
jgi:hypothetical protein